MPVACPKSNVYSGYEVCVRCVYVCEREKCVCVHVRDIKSRCVTQTRGAQALVAVCLCVAVGCSVLQCVCCSETSRQVYVCHVMSRRVTSCLGVSRHVSRTPCASIVVLCSRYKVCAR